MKATSLSVNLRLGCNAKCPFCISHVTVKPTTRIDRESDQFMDALGRALAYAAFHRVDTVLITSTGEPLLDIEAVRRVGESAKVFTIPIVELQTNGFLLLKPDGKTVMDQTHLDTVRQAGVSTIAISTAAMDPRESATIMGLPAKHDYLAVASEVVRAGMVCRVSLNLTRDFHMLEFDDYVDTLREHGVHQLTLRSLGLPEVSRDTPAAQRVADWVEKNKLEDDLEIRLEGRIVSLGTALRPLPHGEWVYDYRGLSVTVSSCLTETRREEVRSLILQPDGHVYHSWNHRGSIIL
jgi:molybdenum cofactor biosynthesis enzyme MoaA